MGRAIDVGLLPECKLKTDINKALRYFQLFCSLDRTRLDIYTSASEDIPGAVDPQ